MMSSEIVRVQIPATVSVITLPQKALVLPSSHSSSNPRKGNYGISCFDCVEFLKNCPKPLLTYNP
nr:MAG TPA: hypothetical protein [Caudoviricetes sp.]